MNTSKDIRWQQRFTNYKNAFARLNDYANRQNLSDLENQGLIKAFEYTYELAWKTLQDLLKHKGYDSILGPKPVIEKCFELGYIAKGKDWVKMHKSRNLTSHIYNEDIAKDISIDIRNTYVDLFFELKEKLKKEANESSNNLFNE
jgi:nucleotidyltransferase substrate binding protein (TIGR01987 family)